MVETEAKRLKPAKLKKEPKRPTTELKTGSKRKQ
jgi:hypothetical protein